MKITVIGGGSTYTPELINGFLARTAQLPASELWLMDIDKERLDVVGGFAQRMVQAKGAPFKIVLSTNQREAIAGASYVCTQFRVGQMQARREDEYLGLRHGLIGQETTGIGGMAKALRTIPVMLDIAKDIRETAAGALLVNFTNPSGLVTEALNRYAPDVQSVGVCNAPYNAKMSFLELLQNNSPEPIDPARVELKTLGLNHLTWHYGLTLDGEDVWAQVLESYLQDAAQEEHPEWESALIASTRMIPNYYLQYFYHTEKKLAEQKKYPPSRAEEVMQVEAELLHQYADPSLTEPPADLMKRGGAYYSTVATQLLASHFNDLGETHVVNVRNNGAIKEWDPSWVLELPATVRRSGITPIPAAPLPPFAFGLLAAVKSYEILTAQAAVTGDRNTAYQALLVHPLGPALPNAEKVLDDMLETNRKYLPQFC
ncbi:MAG: 6-phospho-beta-glucosidase [Anaerolineales bacterium]|uniref:6-phospho-beta-glucosidase n=1 Tax=Candidatus Villigracilis proximus TaxID=3140683 RepID=UPI0031354ADA|nr:6-phospho-beta-glucosidase [Anaerolineales bacterium]